jgi:ATP-binding protein involved in chromosome partitioning
MTKEDILQTLRAVKYPPYSKDIVTFGMVKYVKVEGNFAEIRIYTGGDKTLAEKITKESAEVLKNAYPQGEFKIELLTEVPSSAPAQQASAPAIDKSKTLTGVKLKIAVASGKGGVGKSTIAINLARAFARIFSKEEARVGLMDCDIHGPSASILFGKEVFPTVDENEKIVPPEIDGIKVMSMGMLVSDSQPLLWRGPMVTSAIKQFSQDFKWGELDVMVLDLPPGTGDAVLSVVQLIPLDSAVIITTPNALASKTALRGAMVFQKTNVKIAGVVENMAYIDIAGQKEYIFGEGCAKEVAQNLGVEILATIPLDKTLHTDNISENSQQIFDDLARKLLEIK